MTIDGTAVKPDIKRAHVLLIAFPYRVEVPWSGWPNNHRSMTKYQWGTLGIRDIQEQHGSMTYPHKSENSSGSLVPIYLSTSVDQRRAAWVKLSTIFSTKERRTGATKL